MPLMRVSGEVGIVRFNPDEDIRFSDGGKCWVKFRGVTKDRKRDANGVWTDGDPLFLDYVVFGKYAEHFAESVTVGNTVMVEGRLSPNNWTDKEGVLHEGMRVTVDAIGPSLVWETAKTDKVLTATGVATAKGILGGDDTEAEAPF